jgi:hypothetical protein
LQYYKPKSGFSIPALTLSQEQCNKIQGPALHATLSKLHLNRNTSRSVVFGPSKYAGLGLPSLYTSGSIGQLRLFIGHLRLKDKTARLILIDMSYIQLLVGSITLFFNLPFQRYSHSVDHSWLVSIWRLISDTKLQLAVRQSIIPLQPRDGDVALMDYFTQLKLPNKQLQQLNRCRVYLQVFFLSDICTADGKAIQSATKVAVVIRIDTVR